MKNSIDKLIKQTIVLFHHFRLYNHIRDIVNRNQKLKSMDATVFSWMEKSFLTDIVIGFCRICDDNKDTKSFVRFLRDLKKVKNRTHLLREKYVSLYGESKAMIKMANRDFDKLAGKNQTTFPISIIDKDIEKLTKSKCIKRLINYRNNYIGHIGQKVVDLPTREDINEAFRLIESTMLKYQSLIKAQSSEGFTPTIQGDWEEVFTIPWILKVDHVTLNKLEQMVWDDIAQARSSYSIIDTFIEPLRKDASNHILNRDASLTNAIIRSSLDSTVSALGRIFRLNSQKNECSLLKYREMVINILENNGPILSRSKFSKDNVKKLLDKSYISKLSKEHKKCLKLIKNVRDKCVAHSDLDFNNKDWQNLIPKIDKCISFAENCHRQCLSAIEDRGGTGKYISSRFSIVSEDWIRKLSK